MTDSLRGLGEEAAGVYDGVKERGGIDSSGANEDEDG